LRQFFQNPEDPGWMRAAFVNVQKTASPGGGVTVTLAPPVETWPSGKTQALVADQGETWLSETV